MAKYWIRHFHNDDPMRLVEIEQFPEDWQKLADAGAEIGTEIPWWLAAKHEQVRRDIKNLNAELLERRDRKYREEVSR